MQRDETMEHENMGGILSAIIVAFFIAVIVIIALNFLDIIARIAAILGIGFIIVVLLFFIVSFVVPFFALFYYLAAKKPKTEPGTYKLEEVKGKRD